MASVETTTSIKLCLVGHRPAISSDALRLKDERSVYTKRSSYDPPLFEVPHFKFPFLSLDFSWVSGGWITKAGVGDMTI